MIDGLKALESEARRDLQRLNWPAANWVLQAGAAGGTPVLDVLVVGGGLCGQAAAFALMREGVRNLRVVERKAAGLEGPWATFARMETLRSPKHLTGPDLGVRARTFRAWYEARHGAAGCPGSWTTMKRPLCSPSNRWRSRALTKTPANPFAANNTSSP